MAVNAERDHDSLMTGPLLDDVRGHAGREEPGAAPATSISEF